MNGMLSFALATALLVLAGWPTIACLRVRDGWATKSVLAFFAGSIWLTIGICLASLAGWAVGPHALWLATLAWPLAWRSRTLPTAVSSVDGRTAWKDPVALIACVLLGAIVIATLLDARSRPFQGGDAQALWGIKAKVIAHEGMIDYESLDMRDSHSLGYPPLLPIIETWYVWFLGDITHDAVRYVFPLTLIAMIVFFTSGLRGLAPMRVRYLACVMFAMTPKVLDTVSSGHADFLLATLGFGAFVYLARYLRERDRGSLLVLWLLASGAALTRLEGLVLLVAVAFVVLLGSGSLRNGLRCVGWGALITMVCAAPWWILKAVRGYTVIAGADDPKRNFPKEALAPFQHWDLALERAQTLVHGLGSELVAFEHWGVLWVLCAILFGVSLIYRAPRATILLTLLVAAYLLGHLAALFVSAQPTHGMGYLFETYLPRGVLHVLPMAVGLCALQIPRDASSRDRA